MDILIFILLAFGAANIVSHGKILEPLRKATDRIPYAGSMFRCPMCLGFWAGFLLSLICGLGIGHGIVLDGIFASGASFILYGILHKLGAYEL